jgi:solute carrier family 35, member C2
MWKYSPPRSLGVANILRDHRKKAVPTAVATSLDIGLSNLSLKMITLSFYTMCKSSSLIFVLMFAFLLRLEKPSLRLILVITFIAAGVLLMVFTTTTFSLVGLFLVLGASFMGGLRWGLTQLLLKKKEMGMNNPAATVYWIAPAGAVTLALVSMAIEGWIRVWNNDFWERVGLLKSLFYLLAPGVVAFCMVMSEY